MPRRIEGYVNEDREPVLEISIPGLDEPLEAIVDTGFNGTLLIPRQYAEQAGFILRATEHFTLADGSLMQASVMRGLVLWFGAEQEVDVVAVEADSVLLGTEMLDGCKLEIDFTKRRLFITRRRTRRR